MVFVIVLIVHIIVSLLLMGSVLLQSGRGGALAASFGGGGGNQTLFGGRGATSFLTKASWILGVCFFVTSLTLALTIGSEQAATQPRSLLRENPIEAPATTPGSGLPALPEGESALPEGATAPAPAPSAPAAPEGGTPQGQ